MTDWLRGSSGLACMSFWPESPSTLCQRELGHKGKHSHISGADGRSVTWDSPSTDHSEALAALNNRIVSLRSHRFAIESEIRRLENDIESKRAEVGDFFRAELQLTESLALLKREADPRSQSDYEAFGG